MVFVSPLSAKKGAVKTVIRSWQLPSPTYLADTVPVDTNYLNLPMREPVYTYSISNVWNGSLISPVQSRLYFTRRDLVEDVFGKQYTPYLITPGNVRFYNTTLPFSNIAYKKGFTTYHEENEVNFLFTGNITKRFNLGLQMNYLNAAGHYQNQENKLFNGSVFGSYNGDHYSIQAAFMWARISNFENGGINDLEDLKGTLEPEDIPVRMKGMSAYRYMSGFINHYYSITKEREHHDTVEVKNNFGEKELKDTLLIEHIPMITFAHTIDINNSNRRYIEKENQSNYYPNSYRSWKETRDSTDMLTISNTLSVTFEEEFNRVLKFGAMVYAKNECQRFYYPMGINSFDFPTINNPSDTLLSSGMTFQRLDTGRYQWTNNTYVGGSIFKNRGAYLRYGANGDVCVLGYKLGQFQVNGHVEGFIPIGKDIMSLSARVSFRNETPNWYIQNYVSNHFRWNNDFSKPMRFNVSGEVSYPTKWVKPRVNIDFENVTRPIWFSATDGLPHQYDGNVQVLAANVHCDITTPWVNLENNVVYQHSSSSIIAVPALTLYHNLYYHGTWFKALDAQIGVDLRYFTKYYAPILNPATGQFCSQETTKIGNYPVLNVYVNFFVRYLHLNFFAHYTHFNHLFMRENTDCQIMSNYPYNPDVFRAGLSWYFYR